MSADDNRIHAPDAGRHPKAQGKTCDPVNHPAHYKTAAGIEAIDVIESYGFGGSFHLGNAVKYLLRAGRKGDAAQDLRKAEWYAVRWSDRMAGGHDDEWPEPLAGRPSVAAVTAAFGISGSLCQAVTAVLRLPGLPGSGACLMAGAAAAVAAIRNAAEQAEAAGDGERR